MNGFVCAACGEKHHGEPYRVSVEVTVGRMRDWPSPSLFARDDTYEAYCQQCAYGIATYVTRLVGLQKPNRGFLTNRESKLDAERRMAEIGRNIYAYETRERNVPDEPMSDDARRVFERLMSELDGDDEYDVEVEE